MNPVIHPSPKSEVVYELTDEDRKTLAKIKLIPNVGDTIMDVYMHRVCAMQAVSLVTTQPNSIPPEKPTQYQGMSAAWVDDHPICVSKVITDYIIALNDADWVSTRQRNQLKTLVEDIINTCPIKTIQLKVNPHIHQGRSHTPAYRKAERARKAMLERYPADWEHISDLTPDQRISWPKRMQLIRDAANLFRTDDLVTTNPDPAQSA